jgi:hypothetical protein
MKNTVDQPLTKLADAAFEQAAQKVIERARQSGTPVIVWEDNAVKELEPPQNGETPCMSNTRESTAPGKNRG